MISEKLKNIPKFAGCYLFKDDKEQVIYVGMSKYLPKRVSSYFQKKHSDFKTKQLVEKIYFSVYFVVFFSVSLRSVKALRFLKMSLIIHLKIKDRPRCLNWMRILIAPQEALLFYID